MKMRKWTHWRVESIEKQRGISLLTVLLILLIVSLLGTASVQITMMSERGARNDRDMDLAWQAAEMGLVGAEIEVQGPNSASNSRTQKILSGHVNIPSTGCQTNGDWRGFCFYETKVNGKSRPTWLTVDIAETGSTSPSVEFGTFTGLSFASASQSDGKGIQPAYKPRYIIEDVSDIESLNAGGGMVGARYVSAADPSTTVKTGGRVYRITSLGFGPRKDIQAVVQSIYRN